MGLVVPGFVGPGAFWLGKKADEFHSHRWTVYLRSAADEDISHIVSKVVFTLHHSDCSLNPLSLCQAVQASFERKRYSLHLDTRDIK